MKLEQRRGFSLVELLLVIGIIALLLAMLMPALSRARRQAQMVACQSNMRQVGQAMVIYAQQWNGWIFPPEARSGRPENQRLPALLFKPPVWNPPIMLCPSDIDPVME